MTSTNVKNGTPVGSRHLCRTCNWGQFTSGYRESDLLVICMRPDPARVVPFVVHTCTEYEQRNHPDWDRMKEMAVPLRENRKKSLGFSGAGFGLTLADEDEETQDAALIASA